MDQKWPMWLFQLWIMPSFCTFASPSTCIQTPKSSHIRDRRPLLGLTKRNPKPPEVSVPFLVRTATCQALESAKHTLIYTLYASSSTYCSTLCQPCSIRSVRISSSWVSSAVKTLYRNRMRKERPIDWSLRATTCWRSWVRRIWRMNTWSQSVRLSSIQTSETDSRS